MVVVILSCWILLGFVCGIVFFYGAKYYLKSSSVPVFQTYRRIKLFYILFLCVMFIHIFMLISSVLFDRISFFNKYLYNPIIFCGVYNWIIIITIFYMNRLSCFKQIFFSSAISFIIFIPVYFFNFINPFNSLYVVHPSDINYMLLDWILVFFFCICLADEILICLFIKLEDSNINIKHVNKIQKFKIINLCLLFLVQLFSLFVRFYFEYIETYIVFCSLSFYLVSSINIWFFSISTLSNISSLTTHPRFSAKV
eukprot:TRINITY_DN2252_c0_g1_i1.p1 TRINITY_DN2252_c0_g1~~TRINITY_DN2252_c0_g1_i1.p1  ORF type:complete len:254 (+),score=14.80 TRINITY_DN2252_c0_g1_i1:893-1654(+)